MQKIIIAVWIALLDGILSHKTLFDSSDWLRPHYSPLEKARNALLLALLIQAGTDPVLDGLREDALGRDGDHDASHRALRALLDAFELHCTGADLDAVTQMRTTLYPAGLAFIQQSYRAQVGQAELFEQRVADDRVKTGLAALAKELKNPEQWLDRCLEANQKMAEAVAKVDARIAELTSVKNQSEIPGLTEARNQVFKRFGLFLNSMEDAYPEGSTERETLIGPYLRELAKANKPKPQADAGQPGQAAPGTGTTGA